MATILVVDDRASNREYLVTLLGYVGHRLVEAADGGTGLAIARAERPDLIITDIVMPTMDGYEFARQVRSDPAIAATPTIFITASYLLEETRRLAQACAVTHVLVKPVEPEVILTAVQAALRAGPALPPQPVPEDFHQEHMRLLTDGLAKRVEALEAEILERQQAESALQRSQARLQSTMDGMLEGAQIVSPEWRYLYVNAAAAAQGKQTPAELLGHTMMEIYPGIEHTALFMALREVLAQQAPRRLENEFEYPDGSKGWFDLHIQPVPEGLFILSHDITARRRAEEQLRLQSAALNAAANAIVITNAAGQIQWVNPAFTRLTGYAAEAVIGQSPRLLKSGQHDQGFYQRMWATIAAGEVWHSEMVNRRVDGSLYTQEQTVTPLLDTNGQITHYIAIQQDVTERKQIEAHLRYLAAIVENVSDGIVSTDLQMNIRSWNAGAEAMFGYAAAEVIGRPYSEVVTYDYLEGDEDTARRAVAETGRWQGEVRARRKDGTPLYALVAGTLVKDDDGTATGFSAVLHDITARKQAEAQYRTLVEQMPAITYTAALDETNATLYISPQIERLGYTPADYLGDPALWLRNIHPDDRERVVAQFAESRASRAPLHSEYRLLARDGRVVWLQDDAVIVYDAAGQPLCHQGVVIDITERKLRERELEAIAAVSTALRAAHNQAEMLPIIVGQITGLLNVTAVAVGLRDTATDALTIVAAAGGLDGLVGQQIPPGVGIGGQVLATGQPYVTADSASDPHFYLLNEIGLPPATVCLPLIGRQQTLGVLWAGRLSPFTRDEVRVLIAIVDIAANAIQRAALHELTEQRLQRLAALREIDSAIMNSLDLGLTLGILLHQAASQLEVAAANVLLLNPATRRLEFAAGQGFRSKGIEQTRLRLGDGFPGQVALERRVVVVADLPAEQARFLRAGVLAGEDFIFYACAPLLAKGQVLGVMEVFHRAALQPDADWLSFLETLAGQAAIAVADARLFEELQRSNLDLMLAYDSTLEGWSAALDLRDHETEGHSQRVTEMTLVLAEALGVTESERIHMRRGALLHDIGKMGVPDAVLHKPGPLSDEEWVLMRQHPVLAYQLLAPIAYLRPALDIPYCHHEKWDGSGYPRGLKGEAIPLAARIFALVDVWDALRSKRPYRDAWPASKVRDYIRQGAGSHFDPNMVEAFLTTAPPD